MAKVSPVSIKYMIHASFKAEGPLEKPDVIGAIFGQTEGLLGAELEMRELQKEGKIGRIEVDLDIADGKTVGDIQVPTALDKSETTLIAAALETIDKIGPTEAQIKVTKIEDVRGSKREFILQRAKALLGGLENNEVGEFSKTLKEETRAAKIQEYGEEKLPAGDLSEREIIVVEGRADVINLLKNRVNNVIGMNGTKLPAEIARLGEEKDLTLFVDGDRGGQLIARNVIAHARVKDVAVAPDGKEVEELTGKEILMALRKKVPISVYLRSLGREDKNFNSPSVKTEDVGERGEEKEEREVEREEVGEYNGDAKAKIREIYETIRGTKATLMLDSNLEILKKTVSKEVPVSIRRGRSKVYAIIIDGNATSAMINLCDEEGIKYLGATTFANAEARKVQLVSL